MLAYSTASVEGRYFLYAIGSVTPDSHDPSVDFNRVATDIEGLCGGRIWWERVGDLQVAVSPAGVLQQSASDLQKLALDYSNILQQLHRTKDLLPVQCATMFSREDLQQVLLPKQSEFLNSLEIIAGCCEISARWRASPMHGRISSESESDLERAIETSSSDLAEISTGADYLRQRKREAEKDGELHKIADELVDQLSEKLQRRCRYIKPVVCGLGVSRNKGITAKLRSRVTAPVVGANLLVRREDAEIVLSVLRSTVFAEGKPIVVNGPMPVYSFTDGI